jgi:hypothetical protein
MSYKNIHSIQRFICGWWPYKDGPDLGIVQKHKSCPRTCLSHFSASKNRKKNGELSEALWLLTMGQVKDIFGPSFLATFLSVQKGSDLVLGLKNILASLFKEYKTISS